MATKAELQRQVLELPAEERVELVIDVWESISAEAVPVPDWHREIIRERLAELDQRPLEERSAPWEEVHKRVFSDRA